MTDTHKAEDEPDDKTRFFTCALNSLKEEIEAVDWYHQRIDVEIIKPQSHTETQYG